MKSAEKKKHSSGKARTISKFRSVSVVTSHVTLSDLMPCYKRNPENVFRELEIVISHVPMLSHWCVCVCVRTHVLELKAIKIKTQTDGDKYISFTPV